jgi:hypothetical protein
VELVRKLLMTSVVVFMYPDSPMQLVAALIITFFCLVLSFTWRPCLLPQLNQLQAACLIIQGITIFCEAPPPPHRPNVPPARPRPESPLAPGARCDRAVFCAGHRRQNTSCFQFSPHV